MQATPIPLNQEQRLRLQKWLEQSEAQTLRKVVQAKITLAKCDAIRHLVSSIDQKQYMDDALAAAGEVIFYERFLTLLGAIQTGHNPEKPSEVFEYTQIEMITDHEPSTT